MQFYIFLHGFESIGGKSNGEVPRSLGKVPVTSSETRQCVQVSELQAPTLTPS